MVAAATLGAAAIGAGASMSAANSQSKAINSAAASEAAASRENIAAMERERARNEQLFSPYLAAEDQARARLDALYMGSGSYGGASGYAPQSSYGAPDGAQLEQILMEQNPDMAQSWRGWEAGGAKPGGHRDQFGDFAGYIRAERPDAFARGQAAVAASPSSPQGAPATTISRDQVMREIEMSPLYGYAYNDWLNRYGLADKTYDGAIDLSDREFADLYAVADANQDNARALAKSNLDSRLKNNERSYAAWDAVAQDERDRAVDATFSRGGVTGLVGQTRAGVADVGQRYARDAYATRTQLDADAYNPYYTDVTNAENTRGAARTDATVNRAGRRQTAYDTRQNSYSRNYDQFSGDRLNAYGAYEDHLTGRAGEGYGARTAIASGGQNAANNIAQQRTNGARAASDASYARGAVTQQLYGDVARVAGDAYGSITNRKPSQVQSPSYSPPSRLPPVNSYLAPVPSYTSPTIRG